MNKVINFEAANSQKQPTTSDKKMLLSYIFQNETNPNNIFHFTVNPEYSCARFCSNKLHQPSLTTYFLQL